MSLLQRMRAWLFPPLEAEDGTRVLERLGVDPVFLSWAYAQGKRSLAELWQDCPRADWLIGLAARAGLRRSLIAEALEELFEELERGSRATGDSAELEQARKAGQQWVSSGGAPESVCEAVAAAVNLACDGDTDVRSARQAAREASVGRIYPEARVHAHLAELNALRRLAEAVRARLRYEDLHAGLFEGPSRETPYR